MSTDTFRRKTPEEILRDIAALQRGRLKIYLGASTGTGKTYHMLRDGLELCSDGVDVAVSGIERSLHGDNSAFVCQFDVIPSISWVTPDYIAQEDLDLEAIIKRNPEVLLVDDLAHVNQPGAKRATRIEEVSILLARGISVVTTLNVYDLEELRDEVRKLTGITSTHTVPLEVLARADEVKLVDVTPEVIVQRLENGGVGLQNGGTSQEGHFNHENLAILRELTLRLLAEEVNDELEIYRRQHGMDGPSAATEKILVGFQYDSSGSLLVRRGQQVAKRLNGELHVLTVIAPRPLSLEQSAFKTAIVKLIKKMDAEFAEIQLSEQSSVAKEILRYAREHNITRIVIGQSARSRWQELLRGSIINELFKNGKEFDFMITADRRTPEGQRVLPTRHQRFQRSMANNPFHRLSSSEVERTISKMKRGRFKIYIGAAPGVGKTYTMLREAHELHKQGVDVAAGLIETHNRRGTLNQIGPLEMIPRQKMSFRGAVFEELDVDAVIARNPEVVLVDELAHTNVPGSRHAKRYEDILELLEAGISVISTVNVQHLESLNDAILQITGIIVRETVPDYVLRMADEVLLIDVPPETLRQRMREGKIYAQEKIEQALDNFFREGNLIALRELALREVADNVDDRLEAWDERSALRGPWRRIEVIYVCANLKPKAERLIRRGFRTAHRLKAKMYVGYVQDHPKLTEQEVERVSKLRQLTERLGGTFEHLHATSRRDVFRVLVEELERRRVTQVVLAHSTRSPGELMHGGHVLTNFLRATRHLDVLVIADPNSGNGVEGAR